MTEKIRGFEFCSRIEDTTELELPKRQSKTSAGYDFYAIEDVEIPSVWRHIGPIIKRFLKGNGPGNILKGKFKEVPMNDETMNNIADEFFAPILIATGIKSFMKDDEFLAIYNRSSNPIKKKIISTNSVGIIDSDYYNCESNEGEIHVQIINWGMRSIKIEKGERIAQGVFQKFLLADGDDLTSGKERTGGHGSSND